VIIDEEDHLEHYGILRRSGRYPWGSGASENRRDRDFLGTIDEMRRQGLTDEEIRKGFDISSTEWRAAKSVAKARVKQADIAMAQRLRDKGLSNPAIAERMYGSKSKESNVRALLTEGAADKARVLTATSDMLKRQLDEKKFIDIGSGNEYYLNISQNKLNTSVAILREQGYVVETAKVRQPGTGKDTNVKVLAHPGSTWGDIQKAANEGRVKSITEFSEDGGRTYQSKFMEPISINPKRLKVKFAEDGGDQEDGMIYVRRGKEDLSLGGKNYGQVRVKVGDSHFIKGMAIYKDDIPDGVDLVFNTAKSKNHPDVKAEGKLGALKPLKDSADLPFGSVIQRQIFKVGPDGTRKVTSAMNLVNEEGRWDQWSKTLSTQMLSKQSPRLVKEQLDITLARKKNDLDEIKRLNNPVIKKKLLETYADSTDSSSVHMKAAKFPGQATKVILPVNKMKETEIYAPSFNNGDRVVLIRYPHGGTFEIPELTVNNKNRAAKQLLGDARDAVGIHHSVAKKMSGADFDGDTVLVIPNHHGKIKTDPALAKLKDFDPIRDYPAYEGSRKMKASETQVEMGKISNLITDMTIRGAPHSEIAQAVRHSMVVIDAEKKGLDFQRSYKDNGIPALKAKYQTKEDGSRSGGASTLISRASSEQRVPDRKPRPMSEGGPIDRTTGAKVWVPTGRTYGEGKPVMIKSTKLAETDDAFTLVSKGGGTKTEQLYATHSNNLKALANEARLLSTKTPSLKYNPSAKKVYHAEVKDLDNKLALAERNAPRERQALMIAQANVRTKVRANPDLTESTKKKLAFQELETARARFGAGKDKIEITDKEWEAIQAGAVTDNKLQRIIRHADLEQVKNLATPHRQSVVTTNMAARARSLQDSGYTQAEIASRLGVSVSALNEALDD
jgi:hypothetical protein